MTSDFYFRTVVGGRTPLIILRRQYFQLTRHNNQYNTIQYVYLVLYINHSLISILHEDAKPNTKKIEIVFHDHN